MINDLVCEGCGDCSVESNCLSVEPKETAFGRKRKINLSTCNKDFSCLNGFCPSFVTVEGATRRKRDMADLDVAGLVRALPAPDLPKLDAPYDLLVAGVGGTGVVTVGALITMAAHLEGKGSSVLDFTGFAQKFGTVLGYVRLARTPQAINQVRIEARGAEAVIACDAVVASSPKASLHYREGTSVVLNRAEMPTGDLVLHRDADLKIDAREGLIRDTVGPDNVTGFDANRVSERLMGDSVFANIIMLGAAWQRGMVPVSDLAMKQAILLNGVAVEKNARAFDLGRVLAGSPDALQAHLEDAAPEEPTLEALIDRRAGFLTAYQNSGYAARYRQTLKRFGESLPEPLRNRLLTPAARSLFKLMAIKDEYEVARLHTEMGFAETLSDMFEGGFKVKYHLAPPFLPSGKDTRGRPIKREYGAWMGGAMKLLARMRPLRGSVIDPFRHSADRKLDREVLAWFEGLLPRVSGIATSVPPEACVELLTAPMDIRGYGPVREAAAVEVRARVEARLEEISGG